MGDIVDTLNAIQPYDWGAYFNRVLRSNSLDNVLQGLRRSGYELVYRTEPSEMERYHEELEHYVDARFSLGSAVTREGTVEDVVLGSPLYLAKVVPASKILTVDGESFTPDVLRTALGSSTNKTIVIDLQVVRGGEERWVYVSYRGGQRYPDLDRRANSADLLEQVLKPLSPMRVTHLL